MQWLREIAPYEKNIRISIVQISLLIMTAIGLKNHVTVIPHLLAASKRDAWISVIFALIGYYIVEYPIGIPRQIDQT